MKHFSRTNILSCLTLIVLLSSLSTVTASQISFRFGDYSPADDMLFMETSSITSLVEQVKEFYRGLRPDMGDNEILMISGALTQKLGFNPLDPGGLRSFGIDPAGPIAVTIEDIESFGNKKNTPRGQEPEKDWAAYIPAADSLRLYQSFNALIQRGLQAKFSQAPVPEGIITELSRNRLLHHKGAGFYFARGDRFCVFSNTRERALAAIQKSGNPLTRAPHYIRFRQLTDTRYNSSDIVLAYCLNRKGIDSFSFLKNFSRGMLSSRENTPAMQMYTQINNELQENVVAEGGMFSFSRKKASMRSDSIYKEGYLSDRTKILPGLLSIPYRRLSADSFGKKPAVYGRAHINFPEILELMKVIIPNFEITLNMTTQQIREKTGADFINDCINKMNGNFAFIIDRFPETAQPGQNMKWSYSFVAGFEEKNAGDIQRFFNSIAAKINEQTGSTTLEKEQYRNGVLWNITSRKKAAGYNTFPDNQAPIIKETNYLYLGTRELVFTPERENLDKIMKSQSRTTIAERAMNISASREPNTNLLLYIDMESFNGFIQNSPLKLLMGAAAPYFQNMESARMAVEISENTVSSESSLFLK